jgi:hypothetical protein
MLAKAALAVAIALATNPTYAQSIPGLYNTGVDDDGIPLFDDDVDPHYELIEPSHIEGEAIVATFDGGFPIPPWLDDNDLSAWITPAWDTNGPGDFELVPSYYYRTTFDLTGLDPTRAQITGQWTSDNRGLDILLNGVSTGITNPGTFDTFSSFLISARQGHPFTDGVNTLDFLVNNGAGEDNVDGPTGLRVEMTGEILEPLLPDAVPIASLYSTGLDDRGEPLAPGQSDPHWTIQDSPDPIFTAPGPATVQAPHPAWSSFGNAAHWISVVDQGPTNISAGIYEFETTFDLTGMDAGTARISGSFLVDNTVTDIWLNDESTGITGGGFGGGTEFVIEEGFVEGLNRLTLLVENAPGADPVENPGGLSVMLAGTAVGTGPVLQPGDADQDLDFDQLDLVRVQVAAKYLTAQSATWGEGDWNGAPGGRPGDPPTGDGFFNQLDIISALAAGKYLTGPYWAGAGSLAGAGMPGEVDLDHVAVPEPTTLVLALIAMLLVGGGRGRGNQVAVDHR